MALHIPAPLDLTLGEIKGSLVHLNRNNSEAVKCAYLQAGGTIYPPVLTCIPDAANRLAQFSHEDVYISKEGHLLERIRALVLWMTGLTSETIIRNVSASILAKVHCMCSQALNHIKSHPVKVVEKGVEMQLKDGSRAVRTMSWHPYKQTLAVVLDNSCIFFYTIVNSAWEPRPLRHELQQDIQCMEWSPLSGNTLAVGCRTGVCLWNIEKKHAHRQSCKQDEPLIAFLRHPDDHTITSIAWSPDGRSLATLSSQQSVIHLWNIAHQTQTPLRQLGGFTGSFIKWAPDGRYLFAATNGNIGTVWETRTWTCEKWANNDHPYVTACWAPNGRCLMAGIKGDPIMFCLMFNQTPPSIDAVVCSATIDLTPRPVLAPNSSFPERFGGFAREIVWDPSGERIAIIFDQEEGTSSSTSSLVAVYSVNWSPLLEFIPSGWIQGPEDGSFPVALSFCKSFPRGALLAVSWSSGLISFYPFYFS